MKVLVTCPPMLLLKEQFIPLLAELGIEAICPEFRQTMSVEELVDLVPTVDGWIIGDDPATREVFEAGVKGKLKAAVKWGIGVDNVDFEACSDLGIPISNTPNMFGAEVADLGIGYMIALARQFVSIDRGIREGDWPKNQGMSINGKTIAIVGHGDIGKNAADRAIAFGLNVNVYDPGLKEISDKYNLKTWPESLCDADFIMFTCALNKHNVHMFSFDEINRCKDGVRVINVARGPLIDEGALVNGLKSGKIHSAALDVFEVEPLPKESYLLEHPLCILGSHNGSNTIDAVEKTNRVAIQKLSSYLGIS